MNCGNNGRLKLNQIMLHLIDKLKGENFLVLLENDNFI